MFTNNYIKYRKMMFCNANTSFTLISGSTASVETEYSYHGDIGTYLKTAYCQALTTTYEHGATFYEGYAKPGVYFGSGSTPATKSDYKLESPITSGLSISASSLMWETAEEGVYSAVASYAVKNTTDAEINIYEIGYFGELGKKNSSTVHYAYPVLFERTVLTKPITIAPGEVKLVTYKITFNQTLNVEQ